VRGSYSYNDNYVWDSGVAQMYLGNTSSAALRTQLYLHELGHVMGLDHVESVMEIMHTPFVVSLTSYQPGDLTGLKKFGIGAGCIPPPSDP